MRLEVFAVADRQFLEISDRSVILTKDTSQTNQPILPLVTFTSGFAKKNEFFAGSPESM
ncbi:MAG: hypothetical protein JGK17_11765 [Microcoleus sp. PH2017_10_PVI_O_A]|uniref:hypothetical protein n=1 Tax=unclassified Microcoleus TaxID=2642155 RepID=UPI001DB4407D|nr:MULTISPECIES: hypothetical protein [unclassified Microcoleus]MCC3406246.1 hypothetical protein [Microcoleus sp. PH2017_10_PVI_O_A]MCC3460839.1 hypothetical protein [Microcoleus sp. PH2017_11_PCY_U_A]MCC3479401.1 hypothetical protein [Microcoleus sp. PH2017_12_PCY_D_A]MCC3529650.1 hypothetical protein [Microcoleus sp. PH2017_21_RUC_O_A]MCC3541782.1 hypothetical protein [Microcoleus sp. PH2017_22_RUC_O_B]